jgi:hypothetical protein
MGEGDKEESKGSEYARYRSLARKDRESVYGL